MARSPRLSEPLVLVLSDLLQARSQWRYGYDLTRITGVSAGTLYPLLVRLADAGWLAAKWEERHDGGRPPRHLYRLTAEGRRAARELLQRAANRGWTAALLPRPT